MRPPTLPAWRRPRSLGRPQRRTSRRLGCDQGSGPVTMIFSVAIFLGFLLLATQVMVHLYATSMVTAVAFDEARRASTDGGRCVGVEARVVDRLGEWARRPGVLVTCTAGSPPAAGAPGLPTTVRVVGPSPARSLSIFGEQPMTQIDRSASFLTEREVAP